MNRFIRAPVKDKVIPSYRNSDQAEDKDRNQENDKLVDTVGPLCLIASWSRAGWFFSG